MGSGYAYSQTITANTISVCEGDPVQLEVAGLSVPSGGNIQWFVNGKKYKVTKGSLCTVESAELIGGEMTVGAAVYPSSTPTATLSFSQAVNCQSSVCNQSATGEYIFGTDFDPTNHYNGGNNIGKEDVLNYFGDNIGFTAQGRLDGNDQFSSTFDGNIPSSLQNEDGTYKENTYLFPSAQQAFTVDFGSNYSNKPFRVFVRVYLMYTCSEQAKANIKLNGMYGSQAEGQVISVRVYNDATNVLVASRENKSNDQPELNIGDFSWTEPRQKNVLYRVDVELSAILPRLNASNKIIFELNGDCIKHAIDFISFESENVCVTPRTACVGSSVKVTTAGFAYGNQITWEKKVNGVWVPIPAGEVEYVTATENNNSVKKSANILLPVVGPIEYKVYSSYTSNGQSYTTEVPFTLIGEDCANNACAEVSGPEKNCVNELKGDTIQYTLKNTEIFDYLVGEKKYEWKLLDPTNADITATRLMNSAANGKPGAADTVVSVGFPHNEVVYSEDHLDNSTPKKPKPYKLIAVIKNGNSEVCRDTMEFFVYRDPASRSLSVTSATSPSTPLCAAELENAINLQVNSYNDAYGYSFSWTGATKNTTEPWKAVLDVNKANACAGTDTKYKAVVEIDNRGCVMEDSIVYSVKTPEDPTITCPVTSDIILEQFPDPDQDPTEYLLPETSKVAVTYTCGPAPQINVYVDGVKRTPGEYVELGEGTHKVTYTVTDACGRTSDVLTM